MTNSLAVFAKVCSNALKTRVAFAMRCKSFPRCFQQKYQCIAIFQEWDFNVTSANNFVKFWTTGPLLYTNSKSSYSYRYISGQRRPWRQMRSLIRAFAVRICPEGRFAHGVYIADINFRSNRTHVEDYISFNYMYIFFLLLDERLDIPCGTFNMNCQAIPLSSTPNICCAEARKISMILTIYRKTGYTGEI